MAASCFLGALSACGSDGNLGGNLPTPTRSITFSPTQTPSLPERPSTSVTGRPSDSSAPAEPTASASSPSPSPTPAPTESTAPTATATATATVTVTQEPSESSTRTVTASPSGTPTSTETASASASASDLPTSSASTSLAPASPSPSAGESQAAQADEAVPSAVWWLLAVGLLVLAVLIALLVRARRRRVWDQRVADSQAEAAWFARQLLPELQRASVSAEPLLDVWRARGAERVRALEDDLTALAASARDDQAREQALVMRDVVRAGRERIEALTVSPEGASTNATDELEAVRVLVESVLMEPPPAPTPS